MSDSDVTLKLRRQEDDGPLTVNGGASSPSTVKATIWKVATLNSIVPWRLHYGMFQTWRLLTHKAACGSRRAPTAWWRATGGCRPAAPPEEKRRRGQRSKVVLFYSIRLVSSSRVVSVRAARRPSGILPFCYFHFQFVALGSVPVYSSD